MAINPVTYFGKYLLKRLAVLVAIVVVLFVIAMIMVKTSGSDDEDEATTPATPPSQPNGAEAAEGMQAALRAGSTTLARVSDNFFDSGMGHLQGKDKKGIEDAYKQFMITNSGSGVLRLNPNQISGEILRITEDRAASYLENTYGFKPKAYDTIKGGIAAGYDETLISKQPAGTRKI
jgi:hypothetical protein